jgi:hypothetical protein
MKKLLLTIGLVAVFLLAGLAASYLFYAREVKLAQGSTFVGSEYLARQFTSSSVGTTSLKTMGGSVGSLVVTMASTTSSAGDIILYDTAGSATTTSATTTQLFSFNGDNVAMGTYQYDVFFTRGLLVEVRTNFAGDVVLTYR